METTVIRDKAIGFKLKVSAEKFAAVMVPDAKPSFDVKAHRWNLLVGYNEFIQKKETT